MRQRTLLRPTLRWKRASDKALTLSGSKPEELSHLARDRDEPSTSHAIDYPRVENSGVAPANRTAHFMLPTVALTAERALLPRTPTVYSTSTTCSVAGPRTIGRNDSTRLKRPVVVTLRRCVVPNIGRQLILERCIHGVAEQFQSRIRPEGNSALHNQPLLVVHDDLQALAKASLAPTQTTAFSGRHAVKLPTCLDHSEER